MCTHYILHSYIYSSKYLYGIKIFGSSLRGRVCNIIRHTLAKVPFCHVSFVYLSRFVEKYFFLFWVQLLPLTSVLVRGRNGLFPELIDSVFAELRFNELFSGFSQAF